MTVFLLLLVVLLVGCTPYDPASLSITLSPAIDTIEIHSEYNDPGAKAYSGSFGIRTTVLSSDLNTSILGDYTIVYQVTWREVTKTVTRKIRVIDSTAPVITLLPGVDTIRIGQTWSDAGATVLDNSLSSLSVIVSGTVGCDTLGEYEIIYSAEDASGNETQIIRYVHVVEDRS